MTDWATGVARDLLGVTCVGWRRATAVEVIVGYDARLWHAALHDHVEAGRGPWVVTSTGGLWRVSLLE